MKEKLISLETAKLAKKKGFNLKSPAFYGCDNPVFGNKNKLMICEWVHSNELGQIESQEGTMVYSAPTQTMLQKWLLTEHNMQVYVVSHTINMKGKWRDWVGYVDNVAINDARDQEYQTNEDALEYALQYALYKLK